MEKEIERHHKQNAKKLVDTMFEADLFADHITRDDMQKVEELIAFMYQSNADSARRGVEFVKAMEKHD